MKNKEDTELFRDYLARVLEKDGYEPSTEHHVKDSFWVTSTTGKRLRVTVEDVS